MVSIIYTNRNTMKTDKKTLSQEEQFNRNQESNLVDNEAQNLKYNEKEHSYEYDVEGEDEDYQHEDPYDTAAGDGEDMNSDYDEANPYVGDEYDKDASLEHDVDKLGMHITGAQNLRLSKRDEKIAETPEDQRDDLDEEGYPKYEK